MLVSSPQQLSLTQVAVMAQEAKYRIAQIYLHWTAGRYGHRSMTITILISTPTAPFTALAAACRSTKATPGAATAAVLGSPCAAGWGRRPTMAMMPTWGSLPQQQHRQTNWHR